MQQWQLKAGHFTLKKNEIEKLINGCLDLRNRIIIKLLAYCGLRREEAASVEIAAIDWERKRLTVTGKGSKTRMIPIPSTLLADIRYFLGARRKGFLFPAKLKKRDHICAKQINIIVGNAGNQARLYNPNPKLKHINPHILRHSFARMAKDCGLELDAIQQILGHSDISLTMSTYGMLSMDDIQERFERKMVFT